MSGPSSLPSRPNFSSVPASSSSIASSSKVTSTALPARPAFALPSKPAVPPPPPSRSRGFRESLSPLPAYREEDDFYRPARSPPRNDVYIPRSPTPPPRRRPRSPSPFGRRRASYSESSVSRSVSPIKRSYHTEDHRSASRDRTPPPVNFITQSHRIEERREAKRRRIEEAAEAKSLKRDAERKARAEVRAAAEEAEREQREAKEKVFAEERARKQKLLELKQKRLDEEQAVQHPSLAPRISNPPSGAKAIPTGPKSVSGIKGSSNGAPLTAPSGPKGKLVPTGPAIPTGPRIHSSQQAVHAGPSTSRRSRSRSRSTSKDTDDDMPGTSRGRGRGRGRTPTSNGPTQRKQEPSVVELPEPLWSNHKIMEVHGRDVVLKPIWIENPKSPLSNYLIGEDLKGAYEAVEGRIGGKKLFRVSIVVDSERNVVGMGDDANRKEAEKLAALSAVFQLAKAGLLDKPSKPAKKSASTTQPASTSQPTETATLSDGSEISYDRARQFMEYYCKRYRFGKPDLEYSQSQQRTKKGKPMVALWDAVMTVGGRKIGMGQASTKKTAQIKCYLDVTTYLESCDPDLWRDFLDHSKKDTSAQLGLAPHLIFQMSDELNEDIQGLCGDVRHSLLFKSAPQTTGDVDQVLPAWSGGQRHGAQADLNRKSEMLQDRLADYSIDPLLEEMRATRSSLPVTARATDILAKIEVNDVTIVMAATGSGKTTQIPQLLFDDFIKRGQGARCNIICTQPRRLAAQSVSKRIAAERGQRLQQEIGYQVRFDTKLPQPDGSITFCTTGIFLKRMQSALGTTANPTAVAAMDTVSHIVVDEVHERDIDTDLLLVVLKRLIADRKARKVPLKVILMSATIDPTLFQRYFSDAKGRLAPVAEVPGRTYPVERHDLDEIVPTLQKGLPRQMGGWVFDEKNVIQYLDRELSRDKAQFSPATGIDLEIPYPLVALTIAYVLQRSDDGHVLVFLPGWDEIKKVANILLDNRSPLLGLNFGDTSKFSLHYLHSTIPAAEQDMVFQPPPQGVRRIILATNIAETSITIPNVVYVVDSGRVKEKRYDPERHMSSLVSAWVGASNLNQRAGRAGRMREGEYFGLLSKYRMESLDTHQMVEMKRSDLSNVVMHVKALNLGEVEEVLASVIEPPESNRIVAAMSTLRMLGALDAHQNLTSLGRVLLQLPIEAAIGKMCLYGSFFRCLDSALTLAAVLTSRDPFLAPIERKREADEIKDSWSPHAFRSDPLAIVAAFNAWNNLVEQGDRRSAMRFTDDNFLSRNTLEAIKQVKTSLLDSLDQAGVVAVSAGGMGRIGRRGQIPKELNENNRSLPMVAALIATASAPNFALRTSEKTCRTAQDKVVTIHNASVNSRKRETSGPEEPSASFNPAEKRLYAFQDKSRNPAPGQNPANAPTQLRTVTRLDPMTYMLFGAYELVVTQRGLECDNWLPVTGNLHALDDVQRLKGLLETCMLRVFEGLGKSLTQGRDQRWATQRASVSVRPGTSRIQDTEDAGDDEGENESDDEGDNDEGEGASGGTVPGKKEVKATRKVEPLGMDEIKELELLTTDIVRILDAYAAERSDGAGSSFVSRAPSRAPTPGVYRPPPARLH